ncbi:MAG: hypothetical protein LBJ02_12030 [Bifidobacteriaceae bacterium]|jgi:hypothetical protein|nr:hypothetical protein [Bifidobacteriaceae bacterium]
MPHRVLIDFNCPEHSVVGDADKTGSLPARLRKVLVEKGEWSSAQSTEEHGIIDRMAAQLPDHDIASFVKNVKWGMQRTRPRADLTIGWYVDSSIGKIRVRIASQHEGVLAELARELATLLLREFGELDLTLMAMFQARGDDALMSGKQQELPRYRFWSRDNIPVSVPFTVSLFILAIGGLVAWLTLNHPTDFRILEETPVVWYGRLFGPMAMAIITLGSTILRDRRQQNNSGLRFAEWELNGP